MVDIIERDGKAWVKCQHGDCEKPAIYSAGTWVFCGEHINTYVYSNPTAKALDECDSWLGTVTCHGQKHLLQWARG